MISTLSVAALLLSSAALQAADPIARGTGRGYRMDYGPVLGYTINCRNFNEHRPDNLALKGLAIRLATNDATVCFDTELLRYAAGWAGGFLDISHTHLDSAKGSHEAFVDGKVLFATPSQQGWSTNEAFGNTPLRWKGYYRHGYKIVLNYEVAGTEIWEMPVYEPVIRRWALSRHIRLAGPRPDLHVMIADGITAKIPGSATSDVYKITFIAQAKHVDVHKSQAIDPRELCRGGHGIWREILSRRGGKLGTGSPYTVDTVHLPEQNPWGSWMRLTAFDFFSDGRAAVSTWSGDVWIASDIDDKLNKVQWRRFASGLFEPLGLRIVDDQLYVLCRDQLARLHDLNKDGEADWVESFNRDAPVGPSYHAFAMELQTDRAGNFYYTRCGQRVDPALPLQGGLVKVSRDGKKSELIATGLRAANGLGVGPNDEITTADNQGNWIPASRLNWIEPGGFYGYVPHARRTPVPTDANPPLCWIPVQVDNSSGSQVWVTSDDWGPLKGDLLHTSYGKGALFLVLHEQVNGVRQGGVVQFPLKFDSGIMRARFHPTDHQLYVAGLRGWQSAGARDGCLQRVRYTGGALTMPTSLKTLSDGVVVGFDCELDSKAASDAENYAVERWNYLWSDKYGSPEFKVSQPGKQGRDKMEITSAQLSSDLKSVTLKIADLRPAHQMRLQFRLKAKDGPAINHEIYHTINALPGSVAQTR